MKFVKMFLLISIIIIIMISVLIFLKIKPTITGDAVVRFSIVKEEISEDSSEGGGGGRCVYDPNFDWNCSEWNKCIGRIQTRKCKEKNNCGNVYGKPIETKNCTLVPEQLFDITFTLDDYLIQSLDELTAIVTFESFGTMPTPVNLLFTILNETGEEVYTKNDSVIVTTEVVLIKSFENIDINLKQGKYTIILTTLYNVNVEDEFRQEFEVKRGWITGRVIELFEGENKWYGVIIVILMIILILLKIKKSKFKRQNKNKKDKKKKIWIKH